MSREEKEALLNKRMEEIRQKNAALKKRYEEIEADKKLAKTQMFRDKDGATNNKISKEPTKSQQPSSCPKPRQPKPQPRMHSAESLPQSSFGAPEQEKKRYQRLSEDDGPPPDPTNRFLADRSRDNRISASNQDRRRGSRRHPGNYGGQDFSNVKSTIQHQRTQDKMSPRQPPKNKMEMALTMTGRERCEYEQWRSEQKRIERDRISRQKTSSGEWKREWDREKIFNSNPSKSRGDDSAAVDRNWGGRNRGGGSRVGRGGHERPHGEQEFDQPTPQQKINETKSREEDDHHNSSSLLGRHVNLKDDSINISISNELAVSNTTGRQNGATSSTGPSQRAVSLHENQQQRTVHPSKTEQNSQNVKVLGATHKALQLEVPAQCKPVKEELTSVVNLTEKPVIHALNDAPDDESWDDEGSWEDATTSGTESQDLSQPAAEPETLPSHAEEVFIMLGIEKQMPNLTTETQLLHNSMQATHIEALDQPITEVATDSTFVFDTRESTPLADNPILVPSHIHEDMQHGVPPDQIQPKPTEESWSDPHHDEPSPRLEPAEIESNSESCSKKIPEMDNTETQPSGPPHSPIMESTDKLQDSTDQISSEADGVCDAAIPKDVIADPLTTLNTNSCQQSQNDDEKE